MQEPIPLRPQTEEPIRPVRLERMAEDPASALIARLMDTAFVILGTRIRFGFDALIGLFPGVGDSIGALISSVMIAHGARMGVPRIVLARMAGNILINTFVGTIPIIGDVFSVFFRSNVKNYELLRRYAGRQRRAGVRDWIFVIGFLVILLAVLALLIAAVVFAIRQLIRSAMRSP